MFSIFIRNGINVFYFWDFDDGESVIMMNIFFNYIFKYFGMYEVKFIVENVISCNIIIRVVNM